MAAIFADLDGTVFDWGSNDFLPGAYEHLKAFQDDGNQLIFVTQRDMDWIEPLAHTERFLKRHFPDCVVLFGVTSPRVLINDQGAVAINHKKNAPWNYDLSTI